MRHEALSRNVAPAGTVGRMLQLYIDGLPASGRVTPQTVGMYRAWQTHLHRVFGHLAPAGITQADVLQYLEECLRTSARGEISLLSGACQAAMRRREVTFNPCIGAKSSRPRSRRDRYLSDGELVAIRAAAAPVLQVAIDLAYLTGLRVSDLSRLRWAGFAPGGMSRPQRQRPGSDSRVPTTSRPSSPPHAACRSESPASVYRRGKRIIEVAPLKLKHG